MSELDGEAGCWACTTGSHTAINAIKANILSILSPYSVKVV
jgi:ribosomal protein S5